MATAYVLTEFKDSEGLHEVGDKVEIPRDTDEEKLSFQTLIDYGIISTKPTKPQGQRKG